MKKIVFFVVILMLISAYRFANKNKRVRNETKIERVGEISKITEVIDIANSYRGTPYKFGGTTKKGMDCSGLVFTSFKGIDITLPRSSRAMSAAGKKVDLSNVKRGDLLFFNIDRLDGPINHVGLVISTRSNTVEFIHSSTSKGVVIASLEDNYWKKAFVFAKRIL